MKILIAIDDTALSVRVKQALTPDGFSVDVASDGPTALMFLRTAAFDAIVLDQGLARIDGLSILREVRAEGVETPVLFLIEDSAWADRVTALDAGADDCMSVPIAVDELRARLRAQIRRNTGQMATHHKSGDIVFDSRINRVLRNGMTITLTVHEVAVLSYLFHNSDRLVSREELAAHIYQDVSDRGSNTIAVFINRLRRKLGDDLIQTVRGRGYVIKASA